MKTLIVILLVGNCVIAQYGSNHIPNGNFDTNDFTSWQDHPTNVYETKDASSGVANMVNSTGTAIFGSANSSISIVDGITYKLTADVTINSGANVNFDIVSNSFGSVIHSLGNFGSGSVSVEFTGTVTTNRMVRFYALTAQDLSIDNIFVRQKLDTLYISSAGSDAALGDADNPIATIAEALARGFYDGGVFAFRSGDTFAETFTAGNNTTLEVYSGTSAVTISTIDANGYTVTQSDLINPPATTVEWGFGNFGKWLGW